MKDELSPDERELLDGFESRTLEEFKHEHHVHVAWLYLRRYGLLEAARRFREGARALAAARGRPEIYHETMTWAYLLIINERLARDERDLSWEEFRQSHPDLLDHSNTILNHYYRAETLESPLARRTFVMPDRMERPGAD